MSNHGEETVYVPEKKADQKQMSRKWALALLVVILATVGALVPPMVSAWVFGAVEPLKVITGAEWVSVATMVSAAYIGGNIWQKHIEKKSVSASGNVTLDASVELSADGNEKEA